MARYVTYICGGDMREAPEPDNTCPNKAEHTYGPAGYGDWFEWAGRMNWSHQQRRCPGCDRYLIWTPRLRALRGAAS